MVYRSPENTWNLLMSHGIKRLFWDIETSPNIGFFWRSGYRLNIPYDNILQERAIICICYKWEGADKVHALKWSDGDDRPLLEAFMPVLQDADEIVAHNGDKFDLKWVNTRFVFHGFDPKPIERTIDTLAIARRRFLFNSNRLDYIGQFLGLGKKHDTGGFDLWKNIVLHNCEKSMKKMIRYCKQDVKLLEQVYHKLAEYHNPKTHVGVHIGNERWSCPSCGSENVGVNKIRISALGIPRYTMKCKDCGKYHTISQTVYQQFLDAKHS